MTRPGVRTKGGERGQMLILFVAVFSVILVFAGFAIDQGLFYGKRRVAQKDVDAGARAGAARYVAAISAGDPPSSAFAGPNSAPAAAAAIAGLNGGTALSAGDDANFTPACVASPLPGTCARSSCPMADGTSIPDAPSVEIAIKRPAPGLFTKVASLFVGGSGDTDEPNIGAKSTACVGSAQQITIDTIEGIPIELFKNDNDPGNPVRCFDDSQNALLGSQCKLKGAAQGSPRDMFRIPDSTECQGGGGQPTAGIATGIKFTCSINGGSSCTVTTCVSPFPGNVGNTGGDFNTRLTRPNTCASDTFSDTFDYADGTPGPVKGPPGLASSRINQYSASDMDRDPPGTLYVPKACFSPRTALVVISDTGAPVKGFAAVYIVGCFDERNTVLTNQLNKCEGGIPNGHEEIRAVLVSLFLTDESVGQITSITSNSPLSLQTTR